MLGDDENTAMRGTTCLALGALVVIVLGACGETAPVAERGAGEDTLPSGQVTLPPPPTPTAPVFPPREPSPEPLAEATQALRPEGPWLLYCGQDGEAALMDIDGPGRLHLALSCLAPNQVSGMAGLAIGDGSLIQFPSGEELRGVCCGAAGWSADGSLALLADDGLDGNGTELVIYDVAAERFRELLRSEFAITPLGLSPGGTWAVYLESYRESKATDDGQPTARVMVVSVDGRTPRTLLESAHTDVFYDRALGWLSESSLLLTRSDYPCNLVPRNHELLLVDLNTGAVRRLFGQHSYAAFDPMSQTILLVELPPGPCQEGEPPGPLVRMSAKDGWIPHNTGEWGEHLRVSAIEWHPELGQFSVRVDGVAGGTPLRLITLDPDGGMRLAFHLPDVAFIMGAGLYPSPDGAWIVVGAAAPHGTRLYDQDGQLVKELTLESGQLSYGVEHVLWMPGSDVFFLTEPEGTGIFRAAAEDGWEAVLIEPGADYGSRLTLVEAPAWPYRQVCRGSRYTRLQVGDRVMVSYEPPQASWLRVSPLGFEMIGLQPGEKAQIIGGPDCDGTHVWWELAPESTDLTGWAAEGDAEGAWLLPIERGPQ